MLVVIAFIRVRDIVLWQSARRSIIYTPPSVKLGTQRFPLVLICANYVQRVCRLGRGVGD